MTVFRTDQTFICFLIIAMAGAEVQKSLSPECQRFLHVGTLTRGLEEQPFKKICQFYKGKPRFVTLYDTFSHIPVYSAYNFQCLDGFKKVNMPWMYEPQHLAPEKCSRSRWKMFMRVLRMLRLCLTTTPNTVIFERGQLNPDEHRAHPDDQAATCTLTNVVPQVRELNVGARKTHENTIRRWLNNYCHDTAFVVTGVTSSGHTARRQNINCRGVPTYLWSAYCCIDLDNNAPYSESSKLPAFAAHALNDRFKR